MSELIDVHTHVVPEHFPAYLGSHANAPWPSMAAAHSCHRHVMVSGAVYRTVAHTCWDCSARLADMERLQITGQVLSPMPELLSYWLDPVDGAALSHYLNTVIAEMVQSQPTRFAGLAAVPLQDVDLAIRELDVAVHQLGLAGVEIGGNINGVAIGDPHFFPFFEAAADWGAAVFVHPLKPTGMERLVGPAVLEQVLAFPGETGLAAASMITGGTLARLPGLRVAFSHGGGTLSALLPRLQHAWKTLPALRDSPGGDPLLAAQRMYYDSLVYDADTIRRLIQVFGLSQILAGSDYPFVIQDADPGARLQSLGLDASALQQLRSGNAQRWLGLDPQAQHPQKTP